MTTLIVPPPDEEPWPTLGPQVCDFLEERSIYGPGPLVGQAYRITDEFRGVLYRAYEVYPKGHKFAGMRRFTRVGISERKGKAKTEKGAQVAFLELHPDAPVVCDGFHADGTPIGRPAFSPYIPLLAFTKEQSDELAFNVLYTICTEGPDADLFDSTKERIVRLGPTGKADGKAVGLSGSPNARDGARTTFQLLDEGHRLDSPRLKSAVETMMGNMDKLPSEQPWTLMLTTAGATGENSVAEDYHIEANDIAEGRKEAPTLFYFHREAGPSHDLSTMEGRIAAISEATGPDGEFAPGQFHRIATNWDREGADPDYLERVWLNRWNVTSQTAFNVEHWDDKVHESLLEVYPSGEFVPVQLPRRAFITLGFDGATTRDATALVATDLESGLQVPLGVWERPVGVDQWRIDVDEVNDAVGRAFKDFTVWRMYGDPPYYQEEMAQWGKKYGDDKVVEWWTNRYKAMAYAVRAYREAIHSPSSALHHNGDPRFRTHIANAGKREINLFDEEGNKLFLLKKLHQDRKFDVAMAACLSWRAYLDAQAKGVKRRRRSSVQRVR